MSQIAGSIVAGVGQTAQIVGVFKGQREAKKRARRANQARFVEQENLRLEQEPIRAAFSPFLSGKFSARDAREARRNAKFLSDLAGKAGEEALQSNLSFLAGRGILNSGRAAQLQARGAAEIAQTKELTARQVLQQQQQTEFQRKLQAAQILQGLSAQRAGVSAAFRPASSVTDFGGALTKIGGQAVKVGLGMAGGGGGKGGGGIGGIASMFGSGGCFEHGTEFQMEDGSTKQVQAIMIGDVMKDGGRVQSIMQGDGTLETWYQHNGINVTGEHPVLDEDGKWKRVKDSLASEPTEQRPIYYSLTNKNHRMIARNGTEFTDFAEVDDSEHMSDFMLDTLNQQQKSLVS